MSKGIGLAASAAAILVLAACSAGTGAGSATASASASSSPPASAASVKIGQTSLGAVLTGADGKTLYLFTKDSNGKSACADSCAGTWPPLTVSAGQSPVAADGVSGELATITRNDGSLQVTINGHPLYYFAADKAAGDAKGQGVKDIWFAVSASGDAVTSAGASSAPSASASNSVNYGY